MKWDAKEMTEKMHTKGFVLFCVFLFIGFALYMMLDIHLQNQYKALASKKNSEEELSKELYGKILQAELEINRLSSVERIASLADSMGLSLRGPAYKVQLVNLKGGH